MDTITDGEFNKIQKIMYDRVGVTIGSSKKALVVGRLAKRLRHHNLNTYSEYLQLVTYFFREPKHFDFLRNVAKQHRNRGGQLRVWSAACSTGEEAYSSAMICADELGRVVLLAHLCDHLHGAGEGAA